MTIVDYLLIGERCLLAAVFAAAFAGKTRGAQRFRRFATSIQTMAILPERMATPAGAVVVAGEGLTVALLLIPATIRAGFASAAILLIVFIGVVIRSVRGGIVAECRCFGNAGSIMSNAMIVRNALLLALAVPGMVWRPTVSVDSTASVVGIALALLAGFAAAAAFIRYYDRLVRLLVQRRYSTVSAGGS